MNAPSIAVEAFDLMRKHLAAAVVDVFRRYDMDVRLTASGTSGPARAPTPSSIAAIIGYAGDTVRGAMVMVADEPAIQSWLRAMGEAEADLCDTIAEYSNMLLADLRRRLVVEGLSLLASTPTTATGFRLSAAEGLSDWLAFEGRDWRLDVRLNAAFDDGFKMKVERDRLPPAQPGEQILF